jgi:hypothetical protein
MLSAQNEEHKKEMKQLKDEFGKQMAQFEVNVWDFIDHLFKLMGKYQN